MVKWAAAAMEVTLSSSVGLRLLRQPQPQPQRQRQHLGPAQMVGPEDVRTMAWPPLQTAILHVPFGRLATPESAKLAAAAN